MRRHAFPVIVGAIVLVLVALMFFLVFGMHRFIPVMASTSFGNPAKTPEIPSVTMPKEQVESGVGDGAPLTEEGIAAAWADVQKAAEAGGWQSWAEVVDADTGEVLFSADGSGLHTPASTQKVLTARFALAALDPDQTLTTGVSLAGSDLYLWGEGDLLLSPDAGDPTQADRHAGLGDLAAQAADALKQAGATTVNLVYQDTLFDGPLRNPAWVEQEVVDYAGDVAPYAIDTGRVAPRAWSFNANSAATVADTFAQRLAESGITVQAVSSGQAPEGATVVATVESAPVIDQIEYMVITSDNTLAEQYCHLATAAGGADVVDFATSTAAMKQFALEHGVPAQDIVVADCSGLDKDSRVTADVLTQTILAATATTGTESSLARLFPVAGMNGTLGFRFPDEPTLGNVSAKTGSLGHVSTLAGVVTTKSGQNLVFAVGNDHVPNEGAASTRIYIDNFVEFLAQS